MTSKSLPRLLSVIRIVVGLLFLEHGLATAFGLFEGRPDHNFARLHAWAGPIETTGAIFLILELDHPFSGLIHISSASLRNALAVLGK